MAHMILGLETYLCEQAKADYFMLIESIKNICPVKADTVFINAIKDNHIELGIISHNTEVATLDVQVNETSLSVNSTVHVIGHAADCASFIMVSLVNNWCHSLDTLKEVLYSANTFIPHYLNKMEEAIYDI